MKGTQLRLFIPSALFLLMAVVGPPFVSVASAILAAVVGVAWTVAAIDELRAERREVPPLPDPPAPHQETK